MLFLLLFFHKSFAAKPATVMRRLVFFQVRFAECFLTKLAIYTGCLAGALVRRFVPFPVRIVRKSLVAKPAPERFLAAVQHLVRFRGAAGGEPFLAVAASVRPDSRVRQFVDVPVTGRSEPPFAVRAFVWFQTGVRQFVRPLIERGVETLVAVRALVGSVSALVCLFVLVAWKKFLTVSTFEG